MCNNLNKFVLFKKCLYSCHSLVIRSCQSSILIEIIYIYIYMSIQTVNLIFSENYLPWTTIFFFCLYYLKEHI